MSTEYVLSDLPPPPAPPDIAALAESAEFQAQMALLSAQLQAQLAAMTALLDAAAKLLLPSAPNNPDLPPPDKALPEPFPAEEAVHLDLGILLPGELSQPFMLAEPSPDPTRQSPAITALLAEAPILVAQAFADRITATPVPAPLPEEAGATMSDPFLPSSWSLFPDRHGDAGEGGGSF